MNGEHTNPREAPTEERRVWTIQDVIQEPEAAIAEIERLREMLTFPLITPEAPSTLCIRVLAEHEKGQPVNAQDLINALMWRVKNQREQLARLNRRVEEYRTDD